MRWSCCVGASLIIAGVAWLPLLLLSALAGDALGDAVAIPFLYDIEAHVRFLSRCRS